MTEEASFNLENETLRRMGHPPMNRAIHMETWGQPLGEAILVRSPGINLDTFWKLMPEVHEEFIRDGQIDVVSEENLQVLDRLAASGKQLMILTSRSHVEMRHLLEPSHQLASRITHFYYKDTMEFHKPDPRAFDAIERDHGLKPDQCLYVGDSPSDASAATDAGLRFIANLESGLRTKADFAPYPVDSFIVKFAELDHAISLLKTT